MGTETITQRWNAGAELGLGLNREFLSGRATRPACEVERRLAVCRKCAEFRADDCAELDLHGEFQAGGDGDRVSPSYVQLLTREHLHCRRWRFDQRPDAVQIAADALDRLHRQGVRRRQDERRAARRAGRRRRKVASGE